MPDEVLLSSDARQTRDDGEERDTRCSRLDEKLESPFGRVACLLLAVWLIAFTVVQIHMWMELSPVYRETSCGHQESQLNEFKLQSGSIIVDLQISVYCHNPNPYKINILESEPGLVRILTKPIADDSMATAIDVGRLKVKPGSSLSRYGYGKVYVDMKAKIPQSVTQQLLPVFLDAVQIPIFMQLRFEVGIRLFFGLGGSWQASAPFNKDCGLQMMGVLEPSFEQDNNKQVSRLGPLVCRDDVKALLAPGTVPGASEAKRNDHMDFSAAQVAPMEVATGEMAKNFSFLSLVMTNTLIAAVMLYTAKFGRLPEPVKKLRTATLDLAFRTMSTLRGTPSPPDTSAFERSAAPNTAPLPPLPTTRSSPPYLIPEEEDRDREAEEAERPIEGAWMRPAHEKNLRERAKTEQIIVDAHHGRPRRHSQSDARDTSMERRADPPLVAPDRQNSAVSAVSAAHTATSRSPDRRRQSRIRLDGDDGLSRATSKRSGQMGRSSSPPRRRDRGVSVDSDAGDMRKSRSPAPLRKSSPAYETEMEEGNLPSQPSEPSRDRQRLALPAE